MKITQTIGFASALLLAAGCAHEERSAQYDETVSPSYGYSSSSAPSANGTYSGSVGVSGTYSTANEGNYPAGGVSQGSGSQSDNAIVAQVRESLRGDPEIAFMVPNIQITANNGAIILSGSIQSEEQKRQILSRVQQVTGVVTVNNQLNIISQPNEGQGAGSLNPTSSSASDRLYKDASSGSDNSTNNALNPTSRPNGPAQLYQESNPGPTGSSSVDNNKNATSVDEKSQIDQQIDRNRVNVSTNSLTPTSRENGTNQVYQRNPGYEKQDWDANTNTNRNNNQSTP